MAAEAQLPLFRVVLPCSLSMARDESVTAETPRKLIGYFLAISKYCGRTWNEAREAAGVRGIRSILQRFQGVGSNFLPLGTPL